MLGETHRRIARRIAQEIGLGENETNTLESGSVSPDNLESFPHNKGKKFQIVERIIKSRILFLEGDDRCYEYLGPALHYIQDRWTLFSRTESDYTSWELQLNIESILDDLRLENRIGVLSLPNAVEQSYYSFLQKIKNGVEGLDQDEFPLKGKPAFEGLCRKVTSFALLDRPATLSDPLLDLNFAYRICLEVSRLVTRPVDPQISQAPFNISLNETELSSLSSKLRGFPESYLEKDWESFNLEELGSIVEENMVQINDTFQEWIKSGSGAFDYAIFPSYGNTIEDMREKFRLTIKMEVRERRASGSTNPHSLPDLRIDFSSYEQAKYTEEAFFEILPRQVKEPHFSDRIGFIIENILKTRFPADNELLIEILDERRKDLERASYLVKTISYLKKIHEPSWNNVNNLKDSLSHIPNEYKLNLLAN
jgi:hypothetical protein